MGPHCQPVLWRSGSETSHPDDRASWRVVLARRFLSAFRRERWTLWHQIERPLAIGAKVWQNAVPVKIAPALQLGFAVVAAVGVFSFVRTAQDGELRRTCTPLCEVRPQYSAQNRIAPGFELPKLSGGHARLSDYAGKSIVMNFWTKNCGPCLEEMPSLARFATTLKARGDAVFLSVCTDESAEVAKQTLSTVLPEGVPFEVLIDSDAKVVTDTYGTKLYPETWFIDAQGVIRARIDGARDYSQPLFVELVESLKAKPSCDIEFNLGTPRGENAWLCAAAATTP